MIISDYWTTGWRMTRRCARSKLFCDVSINRNSTMFIFRALFQNLTRLFKAHDNKKCNNNVWTPNGHMWVWMNRRSNVKTWNLDQYILQWSFILWNAGGSITRRVADNGNEYAFRGCGSKLLDIASYNCIIIYAFHCVASTTNKKKMQQRLDRFIVSTQ